ncbi:MAG: hypothetical protein AAGA48_33155 [Myxococcota bacterium]
MFERLQAHPSRGRWWVFFIVGWAACDGEPVVSQDTGTVPEPSDTRRLADLLSGDAIDVCEEIVATIEPVMGQCGGSPSQVDPLPATFCAERILAIPDGCDATVEDYVQCQEALFEAYRADFCSNPSPIECAFLDSVDCAA